MTSKAVFSGSLASIAILLSSSGCENAADTGPLGPPSHSPLLQVFSGAWRFDLHKTLNAMRASGASAEEIDLFRKHYGNPRNVPMHANLTLNGNVAVCSGEPSAEYRFFGMHMHGDEVCGKAWHHEDRFEPGDMSKCYARLTMKGDDLHLKIRMSVDPPEENDPEFRAIPPAESGSAENCDADKPNSGKWDEWTTFVFSRS
jgi:hypothetical protein